ncbi:MAG: peptidoglycan-binding protein [Patescibacteria group bacterium]|nr:peptidoglycan-binding protein [Patescibacteria group bacterium]
MDWKNHFKLASKPMVDFGADYNTDVEIMKKVQAAINALGYTPALVVDGKIGPKTTAGIKWAQTQKGLTADGIVGDMTLSALGLSSASSPSGSSVTPSKGSTKTVSIATVVKALKQASQEKGYTLNDTLASLMIGQLRGAEGAYPGVKSSLGGTNNFGAAQVTASLASIKKGLEGWGAFAHRDSDPNHGAYIGWYWIAPSPLEGARYWLSNWWGKALLSGNPQTPQDYARILYVGRYFGGTHAGDDAHDPNSDAGQANINDYANAIRRGVASPAELNGPADDPSKPTVDPKAFANLTDRKITQDLYDKAMGGGIGSSWKYLLPASWDDMVKSNGVVWFGPPPVGAVALAGGLGILALSLIWGGIALALYFMTSHKLPA